VPLRVGAQGADAPRSPLVVRDPQSPKLTFHLAPGSPVVDAPSIGPKIAGRLERAGVITVGDLLDTDADQLAAAVRTKDITADHVRQWQRELAMVCRVSELRGHEAQLLVACGVAEPDELAACSPQALLEKIGVFVATSEGQRLLGNQQPPGLPAVTQWIERASQSQQLRAA
jgi:hypothetical protein